MSIQSGSGIPLYNPTRNGRGVVLSRDVKDRTQIIENYSIKTPVSDYEKMLCQQLLRRNSLKTHLIDLPKKAEPISTNTTNWKFPLFPSNCEDVPEYSNDYYRNNLDWGEKFLGINLGKVSHVFDFTARKHLEYPSEKNELSSLKWNPAGDCLATGDMKSGFLLRDVAAKRDLMKSNIDGSSIYCIDWRSYAGLTLGTHGNIYHCDLRSKSLVWEPKTMRDSVCSLRWHSEKNFLATGNNSNRVQIFDIRKNSTEPLFQYSHKAGVKALSWLPNSSILMSGGGMKDRILKVFDTAKGELICQQQMQRQICSIQFLDDRVLVMGLGYPLEDDMQHLEDNMQYWDYNPQHRTLKKLSATNAPSQRILSIAKDLHSSHLFTVSENATLCSWKPKIQSKKHQIKILEAENPFTSLPRWK